MMFPCNQCGCCCRHLDKSPLYSELDRGDGVCKFLSGNLCSIYERRPLLCRIDECYDAYFSETMDKDEFYKLNLIECKKLQKMEELKMPLPLILGIGAAIAGATGVGAGIHGAVKMKEANDTVKSAASQHEKNVEKFNQKSKAAEKTMDELGVLELKILNSFKDFSNLIEKIQECPLFKGYNKNEVNLPQYDKEELKKVSIGAGVLLGGIGGAAVGTAGGFAAAGATTAAVMALGTASTGAAISSLSGVALTNATLAAIGGGAIAAGGGGMALGSAILGGATLGVGLLVGGIIFNITGGKLSDKADEAWHQMKKAEEQIDKACDYLTMLQKTASTYIDSLNKVKAKYDGYLGYISFVVNNLGKTHWDDFTDTEKAATENLVLLVGLLYNMCKVNLVKKAEKENDINTLNSEEVYKALMMAESTLTKVA